MFDENDTINVNRYRFIIVRTNYFEKKTTTNTRRTPMLPFSMQGHVSIGYAKVISSRMNSVHNSS